MFSARWTVRTTVSGPWRYAALILSNFSPEPMRAQRSRGTDMSDTDSFCVSYRSTINVSERWPGWVSTPPTFA